MEKEIDVRDEEPVLLATASYKNDLFCKGSTEKWESPGNDWQGYWNDISCMFDGSYGGFAHWDLTIEKRSNFIGYVEVAAFLRFKRVPARVCAMLLDVFEEKAVMVTGHCIPATQEGLKEYAFKMRTSSWVFEPGHVLRIALGPHMPGFQLWPLVLTPEEEENFMEIREGSNVRIPWWEDKVLKKTVKWANQEAALGTPCSKIHEEFKPVRFSHPQTGPGLLRGTALMQIVTAPSPERVKNAGGHDTLNSQWRASSIFLIQPNPKAGEALSAEDCGTKAYCVETHAHILSEGLDKFCWTWERTVKLPTAVKVPDGAQLYNKWEACVPFTQGRLVGHGALPTAPVVSHDRKTAS
eukprot:gnl/TRDRNA2_/TRDRNA2_169101_c0_seq1.p1 gnl/TRDRNA2_/TRDRNA2_169101_c0~~gnl/TRDRNA2_/TRDRNA2_169101_c0_seq1.p1  ORF type:complete len:353 (-),score=45.42 gnl/TRDRNA2_/TRDRNA2_169101_c0_seq1:37-1095(-)